MHPEPLRPLGYQHRQDQAFRQALMQAANRYLQQHNDHRFADWRFYLKSLVLVGCCLGSYLTALWSDAAWLFFIFYPLFICFALLLAINLVHDASHNAIFKQAKANRWLNFWITIPLGLDPECWRVRHIIFHHAHTNIRHYDLDIEENFVLRQTPYQRWYPFMKAQHLYWPLVAALTFPALIWVFDWLDRFHFTRVAPHMRHQGQSGIVTFLCAKILHISLVIIIPFYLLTDKQIGLGLLLFTYFLSQMLASLIFVVLILGTHWAKATFYTPPEQGNMPHGFYTHTFSTTYDWHTTPSWLTYWLGGLNLHLTHHLFPNWNHRHYPALADIIQCTAEQFSINYHCISAKELFIYQQRFLKEMGRGKRADDPHS
ncbi:MULTISPECIES: fatty acid desaturase family protein [Providencia]|uniref:Acyl-CoA desaturase n=1 Tax=Providencia stuartii TaxID=588 RepID=A0ABD5L9A5_PROST|nr:MULTISPECIES: acyl-CoA desaturase [Providencia]ELR5045404.1 acyl-CoA desaturase [Providencia rettgeri]ELR5291577.1 acyl-CoA desaturase [Providencia stuartii]MCR4180666.1 acyl-CoA desaturase [Providencia vermicola]URE78246.1 acyl-CoA desaturase [Providencia stuartii]